MAVSAKVYGKALASFADKLIDLDTDVLKCMLTTSAYSVDQDTHDFKNDVTNEVSSAGYTAGGATLASVTVTYDAPSNTFTFDAADVSWTGVTFSARYAVVYDSSPATDATRPLICYVDFGADVSPSAGPFTITWSASGIVTWVAA